MDEKGKLFRAMTWIDDHYVLEAETYGNVSMESRQHTQEQDTIRNLPANRKRGRVKCKGNKGLHAVSHRRKMLAAAAAGGIPPHLYAGCICCLAETGVGRSAGS